MMTASVGMWTYGWDDDDFYSGNHYTFSAKEFDEESELNYFGGRYFDSWNATWTTRDILRGETMEPMSQHRYAFVNNNPVNFVDPDGFDPAAFWEDQQTTTDPILSSVQQQIEKATTIGTQTSTTPNQNLIPEVITAVATGGEVELFSVDNFTSQVTSEGKTQTGMAGSISVDFGGGITVTGEFDAGKGVITDEHKGIDFGEGEGVIGFTSEGFAIGGKTTAATVIDDEVKNIVNKGYSNEAGENLLTPDYEFFMG